ncbi:MAG: zinc-binding dehydrogenase [Gammaproteobacteria bacterium]|nr:zinc-binding dehydrogenase [Gammaproteobacteria bacterium]
MKAVTITATGGPEVLALGDVPEPTAKTGEVKIKVKGFGLNRAEVYYRSGHMGALEIGRIPGIEAVGEVVADPSGTFTLGQKVVTIMGGMMLARNGAYAEYVTASLSNVLAIDSDIGFLELASLPQSYLTVWGALDLNLHIQSEQTILVRGATSALGLAAITYAKARGLTVIATTRDTTRQQRLKELGADHVLIDDGNIADQVRNIFPDGVDKAIEIVGAETLKDTVLAIKNWGEVVVVGLLGGSTIVEQFNLMGDLSNAVKLSFFGSVMLGTPDMPPLGNSPLNWIAEQIHQGLMPDITSEVFPLENIREAHTRMEKNQAFGKLVVTI